MDNTKLKRAHKMINILMLVLFLALIGVVALILKDTFFDNVVKIFNYIVFFVFERAWDFKTYLVLIGGTAASVLGVVWIAYNIIRKRGFLSYVAPIALVMMILIALVAYKFRNTFIVYITLIPEIKVLTYVALCLVVDICILVVVNSIISRISDVKHDKVFLANKEDATTKAVTVEHVDVVDETVEEELVEDPIVETTEEVVEEKVEEVVVEEPKEKKKYDTLDTSIYGEIIRRTFIEKYEGLDASMQEKYMEIRRELLSYTGVRSRISKHCDSYRYKKELLVKINIQGKTLKVFFALDPKAYLGTTYPIIDVSGKKVYAEVPTLLKVKSELSVKRAKQLIAHVMEANGIVRSENGPAEGALAMKLDLEIIRRSFVEKMLKAPAELQAKYEELKSYILAYGIKSRVSATSDSYRYKKELLVKMTIQGKTLKVFFALDPNSFADSPIPVVDVTHKKSYAKVPTLLKVRSGLSLKRAKALVDKILSEKGLTQGEIVPGTHIKDLKKLKKAKAK